MRESFGVLIPLTPPVTEMNFPVHSPAGPIMPLTQRVSATAGQLIAPREERLRNGQSASSREADRLLDQVFGEGRAPLPRHGRSDDFSWPPQAR
jgi:hypothetical protein